ncbi:MAG: chemotaxis protein CheW [Gemmatimonadales bacterium]|jgi:purine-binding chemotaxis protein CheW
MTQSDEVQLVRFRVGGRDFAVNVFQVERILRYEAPAALPGAPAFLEGVIRYGEQAIPVVDLRSRFGVEAPVREDTRIVVLDWEGGRVGAVVDAVQDVLKVPAERVAPPHGLVQDLAAEYISGIVTLDEGTVVVLAAGKLLSSSEQLALDQLTVEAGHE